MLHQSILLMAMAMTIAVSESANGNVVINMPPPTKLATKATLTTAPNVSATTPVSNTPAVGDVALRRFARARYGASNTYFNFTPRYNNNFYATDNWGYPWFFGFPFFSSCDHVGHTTHHSHMSSTGRGMKTGR